jgi:hypothetical protein
MIIPTLCRRHDVFLCHPQAVASETQAFGTNNCAPSSLFKDVDMTEKRSLKHYVGRTFPLDLGQTITIISMGIVDKGVLDETFS